MAEIIIGAVRERTDITPEGQFEKYYDVEFFVDDARHHLRMSLQGWTAKAAEEAVRAKATELAAVKGKKLTLK